MEFEKIKLEETVELTADLNLQALAKDAQASTDKVLRIEELRAEISEWTEEMEIGKTY